MMKIGMIGVGRWGRTLAGKLMDAGAQIAEYDRHSDIPMPDRYGRRVPWREMVYERRIDAVVAATPPDLTYEIFNACQDARLPCLLTKPLLIESGHRPQFTTTTYVDLIHLHSPLWALVCNELSNHEVESMSAVSSGPTTRDMPGSLDYGPHAVALLLNAFGPFETDVTEMKSILALHHGGKETLWTELKFGGMRMSFTATSNGARLTAFVSKLKNGKEISYIENGDRSAFVYIDGREIARDRNHDPLARLVERFLFDVARPNWVNFSSAQLAISASKILITARENAVRTGEHSESEFGSEASP